MNTARSSDGTAIAFDRSGHGPPVILVVGAFNDRSTGAPLGEVLARRFTVYNYDRRGRGASGDVPPYAVAREIDDLEAIIAEAGGPASVFGFSSGAILALRGAGRSLPITKLALYEPLLVHGGDNGQPTSGTARLTGSASFKVSDDRPRPPADLAAQLAGLVAAGRRGDAVELFQTKMVNIPVEVVAELRQASFWPELEATAHTLAYEATIIADVASPADLAASVTVPALVMSGGNSPEWMREGVRALAEALANGRYRCLEGQVHDIVPDVMAPVIEEFFGS